MCIFLQILKQPKKVGSRHGKVMILVIDTKKMTEDGYKFYLSENNIWLVDQVPSIYFSKIIKVS